MFQISLSGVQLIFNMATLTTQEELTNVIKMSLLLLLVHLLLCASVRLSVCEMQ